MFRRAATLVDKIAKAGCVWRSLNWPLMSAMIRTESVTPALQRGRAFEFVLTVSFKVANSDPWMSLMGRIHPATKGCLLSAHLERLVYGGEPGPRSGKSRPNAGTEPG